MNEICCVNINNWQRERWRQYTSANCCLKAQAARLCPQKTDRNVGANWEEDMSSQLSSFPPEMKEEEMMKEKEKKPTLTFSIIFVLLFFFHLFLFLFPFYDFLSTGQPYLGLIITTVHRTSPSQYLLSGPYNYCVLWPSRNRGKINYPF